MSNEDSRLKCMAEAILFAAGDSVALDQLSKALATTTDHALELVEALRDEYNAGERGMQIIELEGRYQMTTRPLYYETVKVLYRAQQRIRLTDTQLETLAIVVYKQPVTRQEIDSIRGVNSDGIIDRLIEYRLIGEVGRLKAPGRPILLGTTEDFLRSFDFTSIRDIPDLPEENAAQLEQLALESDEGEDVPQMELSEIET